jgi:hypothetical protein
LKQLSSPSRRRLLKKLAMGLPAASVVGLNWNAATAKDLPLLKPADRAAQAQKYVEDASKAEGATTGSNCANCALYQGKTGAVTGPCQIFPGVLVKAAGWCSAWAPQM